MTRPTRRETLYNAAIVFAAGAAFPKLTYRLRWPTRLGRWGLLAYVAFNTAGRFAVLHWVVPALKQMVQRQTQAKEQLRRELGREPTEAELLEHLGVAAER